MSKLTFTKANPPKSCEHFAFGVRRLSTPEMALPVAEPIEVYVVLRNFNTSTSLVSVVSGEPSIFSFQKRIVPKAR